MMTNRFGRLIVFATILGLCTAGVRLHAQSPNPIVVSPTPIPPSGVEVIFSPVDVARNDRHSELYKLEQRAQAIAAKLRAKHDAELEGELKKLVEESFEKRHAMQVAEAKALAEKLAKVQETMRKREEKKSEIISRRVKQLLGEADDLDWNLTPPQHAFVPSQLTGPYGPNFPVPVVPHPVPTPTSSVPLVGSRSGVVTTAPAGFTDAPKSTENDISILEIELARAKLNLKQAETEWERIARLEKTGLVTAEEASKSRFAVDARRLDVDLAVRRLQIASDRQRKQVDPSLRTE